MHKYVFGALSAVTLMDQRFRFMPKLSIPVLSWRLCRAP